MLPQSNPNQTTPQSLQGIDTRGLGVSNTQVQGLPDGYGGEVFKNLQLAANAVNKNKKQQIMDNTARLGASGGNVQAQELADANRDTADSTIQTAGGAALQGAAAGVQNRQFNAGLVQQGLNRQMQQNMLNQQLMQEQGQFNTNVDQGNINRMMNLMGTGMGAMMAA